MGEAFVEAMDHREVEDVVGDHLADNTYVIGHLLETTAIVSDREVATDEVATVWRAPPGC